MRYDYTCEKCEVNLEVDKPLREIERRESCPHCGDDMKRQISSPPSHFHGSGFFVTDYKKKKEDPK